MRSLEMAVINRLLEAAETRWCLGGDFHLRRWPSGDSSVSV